MSKSEIHFIILDGVKYVHYDSLIIYLLKCGLHDLVETLEQGKKENV